MLLETLTTSMKAFKHLDCLRMYILFGEINIMSFSKVLKIDGFLDFFFFFLSMETRGKIGLRYGRKISIGGMTTVHIPGLSKFQSI